MHPHKQYTSIRPLHARDDLDVVGHGPHRGERHVGLERHDRVHRFELDVLGELGCGTRHTPHGPRRTPYGPRQTPAPVRLGGPRPERRCRSCARTLPSAAVRWRRVDEVHRFTDRASPEVERDAGDHRDLYVVRVR